MDYIDCLFVCVCVWGGGDFKSEHSSFCNILAYEFEYFVLSVECYIPPLLHTFVCSLHDLYNMFLILFYISRYNKQDRQVSEG